MKMGKAIQKENVALGEKSDFTPVMVTARTET